MKSVKMTEEELSQWLIENGLSFAVTKEADCNPHTEFWSKDGELIALIFYNPEGSGKDRIYIQERREVNGD